MTDADLESRYLGAILVDNSVIDAHPIAPAEMVSARARLVLAAMRAVRDRDHEIDTVAVRIELERSGKLAAVGEEYLLAITNEVTSNAGPIVARLRELARLRAASTHATRAAQLAKGGDLAEAARELRQGAEVADFDEETRYGTMREAVRVALESIRDDAKRKAGGRPRFVPTGIGRLDRKIGGVEYGDITVIGGDTSVGKSTTAMLMATAQARAGHRPGVISFEDPPARVGRRALSMLSGVPVVALRRGDLSQWQWEALSGAVARVNDLEIHLAYCIGEDIDRLEVATRHLVRERGCDVVYLDYVQAVEVNARGAADATRREQMRMVLSRFKRELNRAKEPASGFVLSQFRRRENVHERPERHHLYESAYLEQKADTIILLWKDEAGDVNGVLDKAKDDATDVEFILQRNPKTGLLEEVSEFGGYAGEETAA